ncbi:MAG TPA: type II toxin-antitoxin system RelE/ParE family toxin [Candidatus Kryptonia bacterium]|nr:type II toxin-antitoxin system RelE/ParE family toxin [Candidatus Kryptonia bacterium]
MRAYEIVLKREAIDDMDRLRKYDATEIADAMEKHLTYEPTKESRSRIKRLRGVSDPDYRLRVADYRVFYSVREPERRVDVLRVMHKDETREYYEELER